MQGVHVSKVTLLKKTQLTNINSFLTGLYRNSSLNNLTILIQLLLLKKKQKKRWEQFYIVSTLSPDNGKSKSFATTGKQKMDFIKMTLEKTEK